MITKGEFNTDPDTINTEKLIQLFKDFYMHKRNTYHSRGYFFWAKQEVNGTPEDNWRKLVSLGKKLRIQRHQTGRPIDIKIYHQRHQQETTGKTYSRKDTEPENHHRSGNPKSYEKKHKQSTIPPALAEEKEIKPEPMQKIQPRNNLNHRKNTETTTKNNNCGLCGQQNWSPQHKCPAKTVECNNCHKVKHFTRMCRSKADNTRKQKVNYLEATHSELTDY